ncbi:MAG: hypothetical protein QG653_722 [Patescibacteria group bacterium]|nr:hypothetical protein [Patescibacteria group bacterium]
MSQLDGQRSFAEMTVDLEELLKRIPEKHRGLLFERVLSTCHPSSSGCALERSLAEYWAYCNRGETGDLLATLLSPEVDDPRKDRVPKSPREWDVARLTAATLIQWLGSPVGRNFIREAVERAGGKISFQEPESK